ANVPVPIDNVANFGTTTLELNTAFSLSQVPMKPGPLIFGILNITEDSFSDGRRFLDPAVARGHAKNLIDDGADALDIGAASSNPKAKAVPSEIEIVRLKPIIVLARKKGWPVS